PLYRHFRTAATLCPSLGGLPPSPVWRCCLPAARGTRGVWRVPARARPASSPSRAPVVAWNRIRVPGRRSRVRSARALSRALAALSRSEEHTSELQSRGHLVCRLLLEKNKTN